MLEARLRQKLEAYDAAHKQRKKSTAGVDAKRHHHSHHHKVCCYEVASMRMRPRREHDIHAEQYSPSCAVCPSEVHAGCAGQATLASV